MSFSQLRLALCLASLLGFLSACTAPTKKVNLENTVSFPNKDEAIVVIGIKSEGFVVTVSPGKVDESRMFSVNQWSQPTMVGGPVNGYMVFRATAGDRLAITGVTFNLQNGTPSGTRYAPCQGGLAFTFIVPAGKVIYLSDVNFTLKGLKTAVDYPYDFEAARRYIDANYDDLRGRLETSEYDLIPSRDRC